MRCPGVSEVFLCIAKALESVLFMGFAEVVAFVVGMMAGGKVTGLVTFS